MTTIQGFPARFWAYLLALFLLVSPAKGTTIELASPLDLYDISLRQAGVGSFSGVINLWQGNVFDAFIDSSKTGFGGNSGSLDAATYNGGVSVVGNNLVVTTGFGFSYFDVNQNQTINFQITVTPTADTATINGTRALTLTLPGGPLTIATLAQANTYLGFFPYGADVPDDKLDLPWPGDNPAGLAGLQLQDAAPGGTPTDPFPGTGTGTGGGPNNPEPSTIVLLVLGLAAYYLPRLRR